MAGNGEKHPMAATPPGDRPVEVKARIVVNYLSDGKVHVNAPLHDKILCLGLLKMAEDVVLNFRGEERKIVVPDLTGVSVPKPR